MLLRLQNIWEGGELLVKKFPLNLDSLEFVFYSVLLTLEN